MFLICSKVSYDACQRECEGYAYLSPIKLLPSQRIVIIFLESGRLKPLNHPCFIEEPLPDLPPSSETQLLILETNVNTALERLIEVCNSIGGLNEEDGC